jgi:hypothetical protein
VINKYFNVKKVNEKILYSGEADYNIRCPICNLGKPRAEYKNAHFRIIVTSFSQREIHYFSVLRRPCSECSKRLRLALAPRYVHLQEAFELAYPYHHHQ